MAIIPTNNEFAQTPGGVTIPTSGEFVKVPEGDSASGTSVGINNSMVIPKVAGKSNFFACVDGVDSAYIRQGAALAAFRLSWLSETAVYSDKINSVATPPAMTGSLHPVANVTETEDSISIRFTNSNTMGHLPDGTTIRYMWW